MVLLTENMRMVFREGRTKAVGSVTKLHHHASSNAESHRQGRINQKKLQYEVVHKGGFYTGRQTAIMKVITQMV